MFNLSAKQLKSSLLLTTESKMQNIKFKIFIDFFFHKGKYNGDTRLLFSPERGPSHQKIRYHGTSGKGGGTISSE